MQTPAQAVIGKRRGVVVYHLTPVAPTYALAAVCGRIPYRVIFARFRTVGEQLVPFVLVLYTRELALLYVFFQRKVCCAFAKDIPVVVIGVQPRLFERFIILADKPVQRIVLVPYHGRAVFVDSIQQENFSLRKVLSLLSYIYFIEKVVQPDR